MQTLVAFAFTPDARVRRPERVREGFERVEQWYGPLWGTPPLRHRTEDGGRGLLLWEDPAATCRWPAWVRTGSRTVATLHAPLGSDMLAVGTTGEPPLALVDQLRAQPEDVLRLTPPFVLAEVDAGRHTLDLFTDGLGLGRLHEVHTPEGRFWSNRPVAALLFAGLRAEADDEAWRRMAVCDWAMGDRTPYAGVRTVPAATRITADVTGVARSSVDVLAGLVARRVDPLSAATLDRTAAALVAVAESVATTWPAVPVLSLSGGRDSRLVAAAFLAAGRPVQLRTYETALGEAQTARRLVGLLPAPVEHEVTVPAERRAGPRRSGAYARACRWHDVTEGLRPAVYLRSTPPRRLLQHDPPLVTGVGGELGHAPGYPDDVEQLERLPLGRRLDGYARALEAKVSLPRGVAPHAREAVARQIRAVVQHAADRGVTDAKALDWFYADERLRRWGLVGESSGRVLPLLAGDFVSAALGLSTAQSRASALHTALIGQLVPQWAGVPYYGATLGQRQAVPRPRPWQEPDAELVTELLAQPETWGEAFDVPRVQALWRRAREGRAGARDELLLQRVVWRAAFTEHLGAVNAETLPERPRMVVRDPGPAAAPAPRERRRSPVLVLATLANDVPLARTLARTALGRRVRRFLGA